MSELEQLFSNAETLIANGQAHLQKGEDFDLGGLEDHIEALCGRVMLEMPEIQKTLVPRLTQILENLTGLGEGLKRQFGDGGGVHQHKNAAIAYKTADSRDNFGKRDKKDAE